MLKRFAWLSLGMFLLHGCASMPDLSINYFLPRADLDIVVTQTGGCTSGDLPVVESSIQYSPVYSRGALRSFPLQALGRGAAKADAGFEFFADGRLKSVNATQTGQVGEALSSVLTIAKAVLLIDDEAEVKTACKALGNLLGKTETLTIVYRGRTGFTDTGDSVRIELVQSSVPDAVLADLLPIFGEPQAEYDLHPEQVSSQPRLGDYKGPSLTLVEPAEARVQVSIVGRTDIRSESTRVRVPQHGREYRLPVQPAPWFGQNKFSLTLSEAGRISKLSYAGGGTAAAALASAAENAESLAGPTTKQKVEQIKAEADLIQQQQRLVACKMDPASC